MVTSKLIRGSLKRRRLIIGVTILLFLFILYYFNASDVNHLMYIATSYFLDPNSGFSAGTGTGTISSSSTHTPPPPTTTSTPSTVPLTSILPVPLNPVFPILSLVFVTLIRLKTGQSPNNEQDK